MSSRRSHPLLRRREPSGTQLQQLQQQQEEDKSHTVLHPHTQQLADPMTAPGVPAAQAAHEGVTAPAGQELQEEEDEDEEEEEALQGSSAFEAGQLVDVKGYGRATVLQVADSSHATHAGRVQVSYHDNGSRYWAQPSRVRPIYPTKQRVLVCPTTKQYRTALVHNVSSTDVCLEIGCHEGRTTAMLHARAKSAVGVDLSAQTIALARKTYPHCRFEVCDGGNIPQLRGLSPHAHGYDKILVDIGGIAPLGQVVTLVGTLLQSFTRSTLLVKSVHLARFLEMAEVFGYDPHRQWANHVPIIDPHGTNSTIQQAPQLVQDGSESAVNQTKTEG